MSNDETAAWISRVPVPEAHKDAIMQASSLFRKSQKDGSDLFRGRDWCEVMSNAANVLRGVGVEDDASITAIAQAAARAADETRGRANSHTAYSNHGRSDSRLTGDQGRSRSRGRRGRYNGQARSPRRVRTRHRSRSRSRNRSASSTSGRRHPSRERESAALPFF